MRFARRFGADAAGWRDQEAAKALAAMPTLVFQPVITFLFLFLLYSWAAVISVHPHPTPLPCFCTQPSVAVGNGRMRTAFRKGNESADSVQRYCTQVYLASAGEFDPTTGTFTYGGGNCREDMNGSVIAVAQSASLVALALPSGVYLRHGEISLDGMATWTALSGSLTLAHPSMAGGSSFFLWGAEVRV